MPRSCKALLPIQSKSPLATGDDVAWGSAGRDAQLLAKFRRLLSKTNDADLKVLLFMAQKMAGPSRAKAYWPLFPASMSPTRMAGARPTEPIRRAADRGKPTY
jgi:hypothetical protein